MPTYLVLKRVKEDWVSLPGELLIDPASADLLMARGYIIPVPDNYPGAVSRPPKAPVAPQPADSPSALDEEDDLDDEEPEPEPTHRIRPVARATRRTSR